MSKLIIDETPFQFLPTLAAKIGVDEAIILQQVYFLTHPDPLFAKDRKLIEGKYWVYNSYAEWCLIFKRCWSEPTIKRIFTKLENLKLLIVGRFNEKKNDRTKWYTADKEALKRLEVGTTDQIDPRINLIQSNGSKRSHGSDQIDPIRSDQFDPLYNEQKNNTKEIPKENINTRARSDEVKKVFSHWQETMDHKTAKLDPKRKYIIESSFKLGFTAKDLCKAITGCSLTSHNMGDNEKGERYDGLHVIFRDAHQIERFMSHADSPPKPISSSREKRLAEDEKEREERLARINARAQSQSKMVAEVR